MKKKYFLGALNLSILLILSILFTMISLYLKIISSQNIIFISIAFIIIYTILIKLYLSSKKTHYNCSIFITFIINIIIIYNIFNYYKEYNFINNYLTNKSYTTYNVVVLKKTPTYNTISKLENKNIGSTKNNKIISNLKYNNIKYNSNEELFNAIENGEIQSFIISEKDYQEINRENHKITNKIRVIKKINYTKN